MNRLFSEYGIEISEKQKSQFQQYYQLLVDWNSKMNLTSITDYDEVQIKHFLDSVAILKWIDLSKGSLIDVGTGAGFPGIPLAIMCPELKVTLLDSLGKRVQFLNEVIHVCDLNHVQAIHGRAEDFGQNIDFREKYDYVVSRAVANLSVLSEYCIPFVKVGGHFYPYKSVKTEEEINEGSSALDTLNSSIDHVYEFSLPIFDSKRTILSIQKNKSTDLKYPRKAGKPIKKPL